MRWRAPFVILPKIMRRVYLSHRLDLLAKQMQEELCLDTKNLLCPRLILVPHAAFKQWLLIQLAESSLYKGVAGYKILTLSEGLKWLGVKDMLLPDFSSVFLFLCKEILHDPPAELVSYLGDSLKKKIDLCEHLSRLFIRYVEHGIEQGEDWQRRLFQKMVGEKTRSKDFGGKPQTTIHYFGFDFLSPCFWEITPSFSAYLFSPTFHYWEDLSTDWERQKLDRYWQKKGASSTSRKTLQNYLQQAPPLLMNWGKLGRETLKILGKLEVEIEDDYEPFVEEKNALQRLQDSLLNFSWEASKEKVAHRDDSIALFMTGSSRLKEVEVLRENILKLVSEQQLTFSEIAVFAPNIDEYVPVIQFSFSQIPCRFFGISVGSKSLFFHGVRAFFRLLVSNESSEEFLQVFESYFFAKKRNWDQDSLQTIRNWLEGIKINSHGLERLLHRFVYFSSDSQEQIEWSQASLLSETIETIQSIQEDLQILKSKQQSAKEWADYLEEIVDKYFFSVAEKEEDLVAIRAMRDVFNKLKRNTSSAPLPFLVIQRLLDQIPFGDLFTTSLHAIRFSSIGEGLLFPAKAIFVLGMDEESFPTVERGSSLDLLKKETKYDPSSSDKDRYLFLKLIFAAKRYLYISYGHISPRDGQLLKPSSLVNEWIEALDCKIEPIKPSFSPLRIQHQPDVWAWPIRPDPVTIEKGSVVDLKDLLALSSHPWKFYLQKKMGIFLHWKESDAFDLLKSSLLKKTRLGSIEPLFLEKKLPSEIFRQAIEKDVKYKFETQRQQCQSLGISFKDFFTIRLTESCAEPKWIHHQLFEMPAICIDVDQIPVRVVGEVEQVSSLGWVSFKKDQFADVLKVWPECLIVSLALQTRSLFFPVSGTVKKIDNPYEDLKQFLRYFFEALSAPSPLMPAWALEFFYKKKEDTLKKSTSFLKGKGVLFEDAYMDWIQERVAHPLSPEMIDHWESMLKVRFHGLLTLYPQKRKLDASV